jgi:hypothetical protein
VSSENNICCNTICVDVKHCLNTACKQSLSITNAKYYKATIYYAAKNHEDCLIQAIECTKCESKFFPSYWFKFDKIKLFYGDVLTRETIHFTRETVFQMRLLKILDFDILYKQSSFDGFCSSINAVNFHMYSRSKRDILQPLRLAEIWFHYNLLLYNVHRAAFDFIYKPIEFLGTLFDS